MKKAIFLLIILMLPTAFAINTANIINDLNTIKDNFNSNFRPSTIIKTMFGNEKINLHITEDNGETLIIGINTNNMKITEIKEGALESPTVNAYTTEPIMDRILKADNSLIELSNALAKEEVTYTPVTLTSKIRYKLAKALVSVVGWFG